MLEQDHGFPGVPGGQNADGTKVDQVVSVPPSGTAQIYKPSSFSFLSVGYSSAQPASPQSATVQSATAQPATAQSQQHNHV